MTKISKSNTPFAFTMLTVDTHFTDGYVCDLCDSKHSEQYDNVISCSSKQVAEFVNWLKRQPFYKDTTIIIAGDHLTMDSGYIKRNTPENFDQRVYNTEIQSYAKQMFFASQAMQQDANERPVGQKFVYDM